MICIFIISRNLLAKELFSILEVFCGILYHQFLKKCMSKNHLKVNLKCICFQKNGSYLINQILQFVMHLILLS